MKIKALFSFWLLLLAAPLAALHAQAPSKIFVASYGSDANDGSRGSPKRNFQPAHNAVAAGGQIVVLDTAGYGQLTVTKSLAITVPPGVNGFVTVTGGANGVTINAGASDSVSLRGLIVEGGGTGISNSYGINAASVGNLTVEDCTVRNFGGGMIVQSSTASKSYLRRCAVRGCGDGLFVVAFSSVTHSLVATGCQFEQHTTIGVSAVTFDVGGKVDVTLADCVIAGIASSNNGQAIQAQSINGAPTDAVVVRVENCRITSNLFGVNTFNGAKALSRGNNTLENNANGNTFPGTYSAK
jgi:parallel beta helix pectate lyase-like protein